MLFNIHASQSILLYLFWKWLLSALFQIPMASPPSHAKAPPPLGRRPECQTLGFEMKILAKPVIEANEILTTGFDCSSTCASEIARLQQLLGRKKYLGYNMLRSKHKRTRHQMGYFTLDECVYTRRYCVQTWAEFISAIHKIQCSATSQGQDPKDCHGPFCRIFRQSIGPECIMLKADKLDIKSSKCLCTALTFVPRTRSTPTNGYPVPAGVSRKTMKDFCKHWEVCKRLTKKLNSDGSGWWCHHSAAIVDAEPCSLDHKVDKPCPCVMTEDCVRRDGVRITKKPVGRPTADPIRCAEWGRSPNAQALLLSRPASAATSYTIVELPNEEPKSLPRGSLSDSLVNEQSCAHNQALNIDTFDPKRPGINVQAATQQDLEREHSISHCSQQASRSANRFHLNSMMLASATEIVDMRNQIDLALDLGDSQYQACLNTQIDPFTNLQPIPEGEAVDPHELDRLIEQTSRFLDDLPEILQEEVHFDDVTQENTQVQVQVQVSMQSLPGSTVQVDRKRKHEQLDMVGSSAEQGLRPRLAINLANAASTSLRDEQQLQASQSFFAARDPSSAATESQGLHEGLGFLGSDSLDDQVLNEDQTFELNARDIEEILLFL